MSLTQHDQFSGQPDPDNPGWLTWNLADDTRFNGQAMGHILARAEGDRVARLRVQAAHKHSNLHDRVHGGATLALIDIAMFSATRILLGPRVTGSVTLDLTTQFIGSGAIGEPLDAVSEILKETGRLIFVRGVVEQGGELIASYSGTLRKPSRPASPGSR